MYHSKHGTCVKLILGGVSYMKIKIKQYPRKRMCDDFYSVLAFLKHHAAKGYNKNWHWGRWE